MEANKIDMAQPEWNDSPHRRGERWSTQFLFFSVAIFLSLTSCLTMITVLSNFALTYQTQNMLIEIFSEQNRQDEIYTKIPVLVNATPTSETQWISTDILTGRTSSGMESTQTLNSTVPSTGLSESISSSTSTSSTGTAESPKPLQNPIEILNSIKQKQLVYVCKELCTYPSVISAQLNVSLSGKGDTYLLITKPVATLDKAVAKRGAAYLALDYLYKHRVNESDIDPDWNKPVPTKCTLNGTHVWRNCK